MALKKQEFDEDEVPIFEEALVYKRGEYWQMRMWALKTDIQPKPWTWAWTIALLAYWHQKIVCPRSAGPAA